MFRKKIKDTAPTPNEEIRSDNEVANKENSNKKEKSNRRSYFSKRPELVGPKTQKRVPFAVVEAYKNIRIRLIAALNEIDGNAVIFSSPNASEGKSTTTVNTAITLAQLGKKVIVVDSDIRRATVAHKLNLPNEKGVSDILSGEIEFKDTILHYNDYLDVLPSGPITPNVSELFVSDEFERLLSDLKETYDYVIIDGPPVNLVSDALAVGQKVDGMVLVVRSGITTYSSFKETLNSINQLNIKLLGTVLNGTGAAKNKYKSYYKYNKYGYSKYAYYK